MALTIGKWMTHQLEYKGGMVGKFAIWHADFGKPSRPVALKNVNSIGKEEGNISRPNCSVWNGMEWIMPWSVTLS
jgi:hypothetical protein